MRNLISRVLIITSILVGSAMATSPLVSRKPFDVVRDEPSPRPTGAGPVTLTYDIVLDTNHQCDEVTIRLHQTANMTLLSPEVTTYPVFGPAPTTVTLDVIIPEDTSGIEFFIEGCDLPRSFWSTFFVVEEDTVKVFPGRNPHQLWTERYWKEREEARIRNAAALKDSIEARARRRAAHKPKITITRNGKEIPLDSLESAPLREADAPAQPIDSASARSYGVQSGDTATIIYTDPEGNTYPMPRATYDSLQEAHWKESQRQVRELQLQRMREMEKEPWDGEQPQLFSVGEKQFIRFLGDTQFTENKPVVSVIEENDRLRDSALAIDPGPVRLYRVEVQDSSKLSLLRRVADPLPTDEPNVHEVKLNRAEAWELRKAGMKVVPVSRDTIDQSWRPPTDSGSPQLHHSVGKQQIGTTIVPDNGAEAGYNQAEGWKQVLVNTESVFPSAAHAQLGYRG